jgi:hypothetical protein
LNLHIAKQGFGSGKEASEQGKERIIEESRQGDRGR